MSPADKRYSDIPSIVCVAINDGQTLMLLSYICGEAIINLSYGNYRGVITLGTFIERDTRTVGLISDIVISFISHRFGDVHMLTYKQNFYIASCMYDDNYIVFN